MERTAMVNERRWALRLLAIGFGTLTLTSCSKSPVRTLIVSLTLTDKTEDMVELSDNRCSGSGGYSDIEDGFQVTIKDDTGKILGLATLAGSSLKKGMDDSEFAQVAEKAAIESGISALSFRRCTLIGKAKVADRAFYIVSSKRGETTHAREELIKSQWRIGLTIG
jgi:hypothetical protein